MKTWLAFSLPMLLSLSQNRDRVGEVQEVAPGVYFHQGNLDKGHCNQGWVVFKNFILVIDGNFPEGAEEVDRQDTEDDRQTHPVRLRHPPSRRPHVRKQGLGRRRRGSRRPRGSRSRRRDKYEPARWNEAAKERKDVRESELVLPVIRYPDRMVFDDGTMRVELLHFGVAHTHGDGWAWLPKERILFSGDACVNGPYNFVADGEISRWIETLTKARKLEPRVVGPGHGPIADASVLADQQAYFQELSRLVSAAKSQVKTAAEMEARVPALARRNREERRRSLATSATASPLRSKKSGSRWAEEPFSSSPLALHRDQHERHHGARARPSLSGFSSDRASTSNGFRQ